MIRGVVVAVLALFVSVNLSAKEDIVKEPVIKNESIRFQRDANADVVMASNGYYWQDDSSVGEEFVNYLEAENYCKNLKVVGSTGWRLPTFEELNSIIDRFQNIDLAKKVFRNVKIGNGYWTTTKNPIDPRVRMAINFQTGVRFWKDIDSKGYVRCVKPRRDIVKNSDKNSSK